MKNVKQKYGEKEKSLLSNVYYSIWAEFYKSTVQYSMQRFIFGPEATIFAMKKMTFRVKLFFTYIKFTNSASLEPFLILKYTEHTGSIFANNF